MGCDIHLYQEKKVNGVWVTADKWSPNKYAKDDPREPALVIKCEFEDGEYKTDRLYDGRNYRLFAVLANVRNGFGFAGVKTGDPVIPIAMPRGVPEDCCKEYREEVDGWGEDGHSHSWLTLADIKAYPFKSAGKTGCVKLQTYRDWKASGAAQPDEWCGGVSGPGIRIIEEDEVDGLLDVEDDRVYVRSKWSNSLRNDCEEFLEAVVPRLEELEKECGVNNARLVFFFDN